MLLPSMAKLLTTQDIYEVTMMSMAVPNRWTEGFESTNNLKQNTNFAFEKLT